MANRKNRQIRNKRARNRARRERKKVDEFTAMINGPYWEIDPDTGRFTGRIVEGWDGPVPSNAGRVASIVSENGQIKITVV